MELLGIQPRYCCYSNITRIKAAATETSKGVFSFELATVIPFKYKIKLLETEILNIRN